jgi:hypothetical protein
MQQVLFSGEHYKVSCQWVTRDPTVVIGFEHWLPTPSLDRKPTVEPFLAARGVNFIGIQCARNDWYQGDEIEPALAAIRSVAHEMRRVGFGGSMGGYAIINFAENLDLHGLVAITPQYSIDTAKIPFDSRWQAQAARIELKRDKIGSARAQSTGYIVYDPMYGPDAGHAQLIMKRHALTPLPVYFAGHGGMNDLADKGIIFDLIAGVAQERFDRPDFVRRLREIRRRSAVFWLALADWRLRRGRGEEALRAVAKARQLPITNAFAADLCEARIQHLLGRGDQAVALLAQYLEHPQLGAAARRHCESFT